MPTRHPDQTPNSPESAATDVLTLHLVGKRYGPRTIFEEVSFSCPQATLTLLTGDNGSGKTTLMKIMAGLSTASTGRLTYGETKESPLRIAYVAHPTFLYPSLSALENLVFWNRCLDLGRTEDDLLTLLDDAGLAEVVDDPPRSFSRGMCQKLNVIRACMQQPDLLLLDEPATGLDLHAQSWLREKLLKLRAQGTSLVLISHDLSHDGPIADRILRLEGGRCRLYSENTPCGA